MSRVQETIKDLRKLSEQAVAASVPSIPNGQMSYEDRQALVRELAKSETVKKLASELAASLAAKLPSDSTLTDKQYLVSDILMMLAGEVAIRAAVEMAGGTLGESLREQFESVRKAMETARSE